MTRREAAIVSAYTGVALGDFSDLHAYIEELLDRPVFTHELGSKPLWEQIKSAARDDFVSIVIEP